MRRDRTEFLHVLRKAGLFDVADALETVLPDVVDFERDHALLERYGLSEDQLRSRLGGSP